MILLYCHFSHYICILLSCINLFHPMERSTPEELLVTKIIFFSPRHLRRSNVSVPPLNGVSLLTSIRHSDPNYDGSPVYWRNLSLGRGTVCLWTNPTLFVVFWIPNSSEPFGEGTPKSYTSTVSLWVSTQKPTQCPSLPSSQRHPPPHYR